MSLSDVIMETLRPSSGELSICRISINRPRVKNAFRPETVEDLMTAFRLASEDTSIGAIILQGKGENFCSGGDQTVRGEGGYNSQEASLPPRLKVLDLHVQIKRCPKPILSLVKGYCVGGGHVLHMVTDITLCDDTAVFGQTGPRMGSFDGGYGCSRMARLIGQKKAREMWFLSRFYNSEEASNMGLVNKVVRSRTGTELDYEGIRWCRRIMSNSPTALSCIKAALNADEDGAAGVMQLAGNATRLYYMTEEGKEGREAFIEKRPPHWASIQTSRL